MQERQQFLVAPVGKVTTAPRGEFAKKDQTLFVLSDPAAGLRTLAEELHPLPWAAKILSAHARLPRLHGVLSKNSADGDIETL